MAAIAAAAGCVLPGDRGAGMTRFLQTASAGHTGCLPADNQLSNVDVNRVGYGTWNAACAGKVYLCSVVDAVGNHGSASCAPAVTPAR